MDTDTKIKTNMRIWGKPKKDLGTEIVIIDVTFNQLDFQMKELFRSTLTTAMYNGDVARFELFDVTTLIDTSEFAILRMRFKDQEGE